MKILVTGANGQLGMELRQLESRYPQHNFVFASRSELAIEDKAAVDDIFLKESPDYCVNCAAYTAVDKAESEQELAYLINGTAAGYLASAAEKSGTRFIHISTDYVFDGTAVTPLRESDAVSPLNVYGASKLEGEMQAMQFNSQSIIIRTSWVYSSFGKNFVKTMIRLMSDKPLINVVQDQVGSPTYAGDLADAIMHIVSLGDKAAPGIYNYSNKGVISWYDFAVAIKDEIKSSCVVNPIPTSSYPTPAKRPAYSVMNTEKAETKLGLTIPEWRKSLSVCISKI
ncbi:dTDP-4-dehydrorhamnose reductase [Pollutibacter soli]|uniref:dTDP-4-dehydrorhamnose reductase n=1 Tax=Pollutibacter soli TaxID=3034157 RepID=UPI003013F23D